MHYSYIINPLSKGSIEKNLNYTNEAISKYIEVIE